MTTNTTVRPWESRPGDALYTTRNMCVAMRHIAAAARENTDALEESILARWVDGVTSYANRQR